MSSLKDKLLDWGATAAAATGVLSALVTYDVVQRVAIRFGTHAHQRSVSAMARAINQATRLAGTTFRVEGLENVTPGQAYIVVANHQSLFDISMASDFLARLEPRYVSKHEIRHGVPGVSYNLRRGGSALIDRKDPKQAHAAIEEIARRVREDGWTVVIYPEGTRSRTGAMKPFREAGLRTLVANAPGVPVLPVTTWGGSRLFRNNLRPLVRNVELGFRVHAPVVPPSPDNAEAFTAFVRELEETIRGALPERDLRGEA